MILVYFKEGSKQKETVESILKEMQEEFKEVGDNHLDLLLSEVFSSEEPPKSNQEFEDFLFLDTMQPQDIQNFSMRLKEKKIRMGRVAVRTENNISWKLRDLMEEVEQEFQYFLLRDQLYELVMHPDKERLEKDPAYMRLMSSVYALIEDSNTKYEDLQRVFAILTEKK